MSDEIQKCLTCKENHAAYCKHCALTLKTGVEKSMKRKVRARANNKCETCGNSNQLMLTYHHLDIDNHPFNPEFVRLLCSNCHIEVHRKKVI
jgi:hypothetical protein